MSKAVDPICKMTVDTRSAAGKTVHDGKTEYFCSLGCKQRFDEDLARFIPSRQPKPNSNLVQLGSLKSSAATSTPPISNRPDVTSTEVVAPTSAGLTQLRSNPATPANP